MPASLTQILVNGPDNNAAVLDLAFSIAYGDLRHLAGSILRRGNDLHSIPATELVHDSYLKLARSSGRFESRGHFFAIAARAMRQVILDRVRKRRASKRGSGAEHIDINESINPAAGLLSDTVEFNLALRALHACDPRRAIAFELMGLTGLTAEEAAEAMNLSKPTVTRDLNAARKWLANYLFGAQR